MTTPKKTIAYIDGFNLYHALHDLNCPHLKWLNLRTLSESLLQQPVTPIRAATLKREPSRPMRCRSIVYPAPAGVRLAPPEPASLRR